LVGWGVEFRRPTFVYHHDFPNLDAVTAFLRGTEEVRSDDLPIPAVTVRGTQVTLEIDSDATESGFLEILNFAERINAKAVQSP
jgi:hypothetical protein